VVERFLSRSPDALIDYVYGAFPWFTANSEIRQLRKRPTGECAVYTVGYEQWSVDTLLNRLMLRGIARIIDVRQNPVARRYGFHKSTLSRLAGKLAIEYVHVPELGIPSALRRELQGPSDYALLLAEYTEGILPRREAAVEQVVRLVEDSLSGDAQDLYDNLYCQRGDAENRIKEQQLGLFADRTSCHDFQANQFRVLLSAAAYVLMETLRRVGLAGTELAKAQVGTIRLKVLKIGGRIVRSVRRLVVHLAGGFPMKKTFETIVRRLQEWRCILISAP
jgi:hypothetical protein